ncbi:hypothetical protein F5Y15DRAFT_369715 [Xylariaceae sp. FL0016]|nr:hypothetical protein F5Y15DRAFT_369715 [Xylariaceae sp. FL0016]
MHGEGLRGEATPGTYNPRSPPCLMLSAWLWFIFHVASGAYTRGCEWARRMWRIFTMCGSGGGVRVYVCTCVRGPLSRYPPGGFLPLCNGGCVLLANACFSLGLGGSADMLGAF